MKTVIFDVDGTLYHQKPVQISMLLEMAGYYCLHFWRYKELLGVFFFRKYREKDIFKEKSFNEQVEYIAKKYHVKSDVLKQMIDKWMFQVPLKYIKKYRNQAVLSYMEECRRNQVDIVIYSDYAAEDKLGVLEVHADKVYYPTENTFVTLKPSKMAMDYIVKDFGINPTETVFVGDRDSKDGESARIAGMQFLHVKDIK